MIGFSEQHRILEQQRERQQQQHHHQQQQQQEQHLQQQRQMQQLKAFQQQQFGMSGVQMVLFHRYSLFDLFHYLPIVFSNYISDFYYSFSFFSSLQPSMTRPSLNNPSLLSSMRGEQGQGQGRIPVLGARSTGN